MISLIKQPLFAVLALIMVLGAGAVLLRDAAPKEAQTVNVEVSYVTDFRDARRLVGFADNVFIGRVISQDKTHIRVDLPQTLFNVDVVHNIKGSLPSSVLVNQQGGFNADENTMVLLENDPLLEPGKTYLFATKVDGDGAWHTAVPVYGNAKIKDEKEHKTLIDKLEKAKKEQIQYKPNSN